MIGLIKCRFSSVIIVSNALMLISTNAFCIPATLSIEDTSGALIASINTEELAKEFQMYELKTATPWTGRQLVVFRGPQLRDVITRFKLNNEKAIEIQADDDFISRITKQEIDTYNPILAIDKICKNTHVNKESCISDQVYKGLTLLDGGPIYLVWPIEKLPNSYTPTRNAIWVWFVKTIRPAI